jgi:subtilisin family serine protease
MNKFMKGIMVLLLVCLLAGPSLAAPTASDDTTVRKIVVFNNDVSKQVQNDILKGLDISEIKSLPLVNAKVVMVDPAAEAALLQQPEVLRVETDAVTYTQDAGGDSVPTAFIQTLPWGIDRIDADLVWDQNQDGIVDDDTNCGQGVKVAVLDTGINLRHPDLVDNIYGGFNAIEHDNKLPQDTYGHGTHVAGIIAAVNNDIGVIGAAPKANLYAVKVMDINRGYVSDLIDGLQWCIDNNMDVINMSLGLTEDVPELHEAIKAAYEKGIVIVAAAGNYGSNGLSYPAPYPEVIAVAAADNMDQIPYWSSQGEQVALTAPGQDIYSTFYGVTYKDLMGTSMACPHVTGAAALVLASGIVDGEGSDLVDEVRERLLSTADDLGDPGWDCMSGYGMVNAARAVGIQP